MYVHVAGSIAAGTLIRLHIKFMQFSLTSRLTSQHFSQKVTFFQMT